MTLLLQLYIYRELTAFFLKSTSVSTLSSALLLVVSLSEISILAIAVGGACGVILVILGVFVAVRVYRRRRMENGIELHPREHQLKDPSVL